ncbi:MAG TPA: hypothetical protein VF666_12325 [Pyrinomonadaceae bacterium]|jgi:Tol biopolymer transport system component
MFGTIGASPFQDHVYTVRSDGSQLRPFLKPEGQRSYTFASGNSLRADLVVTVREMNAAGKVEPRLYLFRPEAHEWKRLPTIEGLVGRAHMSPDGSSVVFVFSPERRRNTTRFWIMNLKTGEMKKLTSDDQEDAWDGYPAWRPDGQEIMFIRLRPSGSVTITNLMSVPVAGGEPVSLIGPDESVSVVSYSPDGKRLAMLTGKGLEVMNISDQGRTLLVPWERLPDLEFHAGGLTWSPREDKIAFPLYNTRTKENELWTVSSNGEGAQAIIKLSADDGKILVSTFLEP